jgi:hypothetical protein
MALTDKLRDLDQRLLPGTRNDGEDAETFLRRVAASRAISPAQAGDVMAALRVYFGVEAGGVEAGGADGAAAAENSGEQKDETDEARSEEKSEDDPDE